MGKDSGRVGAPRSSRHTGTAQFQAPDQRRRHEANCCGDQETLAVSESSEGADRNRKESCTHQEEGRRQEGGGEDGTSKGGEEEWAPQESGGKKGDGEEDGSGSYTDDDASCQSVGCAPARTVQVAPAVPSDGCCGEVGISSFAPLSARRQCSSFRMGSSAGAASEPLAQAWSLVRPLADPQAAAMLPGIPSSALVRSVSPLEPAISWPPPCGRGWQHLSTAYSLRNYA